MRHLANTFLDGGESAEKKWLEPLLAASIKDAPSRLRLSHDVTKLLHALAKSLGEGIGAPSPLRHGVFTRSNKRARCPHHARSVDNVKT